ncbi:MAG: type II toxin-antitoxin system antitoxin SocA domain-containing protein [Bacteroidota bacterium]
MNTILTQKQVGQRIARLRKQKGLSQEELSRSLGMSRSSLAQVELGNRNVDIQELQRLSVILAFSVDDFLSESFNLYPVLDTGETDQVHEQAERIPVPVLNVRKFKNVLLYILERCAGKPNVGETVLNKLIYFCDFNYYELYEEHLTGATYRKLPYGPVSQKSESIINQLVAKGELQKVKCEYHGYTQTRLLPLLKPDLTQMKASEIDVIDKVIASMGDWSAASISDYSHKDIPWLASKDGEEIKYELAFYRESPFSVRNYGEEIEEA